MTDAYEKVQSFAKLKDVKPLTPWEDIKKGETYHLPPLIFYGRKDFVVLEKYERYMSIQNAGESFPSTMYKTDVVSNFIIKKWSIHGTSNES